MCSILENLSFVRSCERRGDGVANLWRAAAGPPTAERKGCATPIGRGGGRRAGRRRDATQLYFTTSFLSRRVSPFPRRFLRFPAARRCSGRHGDRMHYRSVRHHARPAQTQIFVVVTRAANANTPLYIHSIRVCGQTSVQQTHGESLLFVRRTLGRVILSGAAADPLPFSAHTIRTSPPRRHAAGQRATSKLAAGSERVRVIGEGSTLINGCLSFDEPTPYAGVPDAVLYSIVAK
ncbi:hypothetical protein EVAR_79969_1 [Eumeta japonica]|uniref:Uncharacterized protein n=1 Tax=Eumeta variegata TaxID=151549 RepID=A0A4C1Y431_EUMVA|nr:hypothetical protein EVAR_79969_1 [Eumeta japonica]